jgi:hypothetical protein
MQPPQRPTPQHDSMRRLSRVLVHRSYLRHKVLVAARLDCIHEHLSTWSESLRERLFCCIHRYVPIMSLKVNTPTLIHDDAVMETSPEEISVPKQVDELRRFQDYFELHIPSARKPKNYDHVGVLLLSFDSASEFGGMDNIGVSEEVS